MSAIRERFRGYLPVVVDVETGGFVASTDGILELGASILRMDDSGRLGIHATHHYHIEPFEGANIEPAALSFTGIDPWHPFRQAVPEKTALTGLFDIIRRELKAQKCVRAILVGHNAHFDAGFIGAAVERCNIKRNPFHPAILIMATVNHFMLSQLSKLARLEAEMSRNIDFYALLALEMAGITFVAFDQQP